MAVTLTGSAGQSGSLTLNDSNLNTSTTLSLSGAMSIQASPANIPANSSDANWTLTGMYATNVYKGSITANTSGTTLTWSALNNALCSSGACAKVNLVYVKNLGGENLQVCWPTKLGSGTANSTTDYVTVPPYGIYELQVPMAGIAVTGTSGITFKTAANSTTAYTVIAYS